MAAVFAVAAMPDVIPSVPSDLVGQAQVSDRSPRPAVVARAEPSAVTVDKVKIAIPDDIVVPAVGDGKTVIVEVDEIGAIVIDITRAAQVDVQIDFSIGIVRGRCAEQQSRNPGAGQKE
jgi:hypothetical protein